MIIYLIIGFIVAIWSIESFKKTEKKKLTFKHVVILLFIMIFWPFHIALWLRKLYNLPNRK